MPAKKAAMKALLEKSFQGRQKGVQREHCSLGHFLETPIFLSFLNDINQEEKLEGFNVLGGYTAGLVSRKEKPWAKDSVDFIATVSTTLDEVEAWPIEIKSRVKLNTAIAEMELNERVERDVYEWIQHDKAHKMINSIGERHQLIHHCYVYNKLTGALIIGDKQSQILQATVVDYGFDIVDDYGLVLEDLKNDFLSWAYDNDYDGQSLRLPREVTELVKDISSIKTEETLFGTVNLWRKIFDDLSKLPVPALARILPVFHAYWNSVKSVSDTTTMLADKCASLKIPKEHLNCNSCTSGRVNMVNLVLFHRLKGINTAKVDLDFYPDLAHYRNAAEEQSSFHETLLWCMIKFKELSSKEVNIIEEAKEEERESNHRPHRQRVDGILPERMEFASKQTFKTPKRIVKELDDGIVDEDVKRRWDNCTDFPVRVYQKEGDKTTGIQGEDNRRPCAICGTKAKFFCIGCRSFFCMEGKETKKRKRGMFHLPTTNEDGTQGKDCIFEKTCYQTKHQCAFLCHLSYHISNSTCRSKLVEKFPS